MVEKKSTMLKVVGILCIIFGAIATILNGLFKAGVSLVLSTPEIKENLAMAPELVRKGIGNIDVGVTLAFVGAIVMLLAGILGVVFHKKPEKGLIAIIFGVLLIIFAFLPTVMLQVAASNIKKALEASGVATMDLQPLLKMIAPNIVMLLFNVAIPVLYLIGGIQLKKLNQE